MKELTQIYKDSGKQLIDDLFKDYLVVTEKLSGSSFSFQRKGDGVEFYKGGNQRPINLIDRTLMVYYEKPISYIKSVVSKNFNSIPENWKFCFQYFVNNQPSVITYDRMPKNHLVLTHIKVMTPNGNVMKIIEDPRVINDWANALGVTPLLPLFKGYLTNDQKQKIKEFLDTPKEDHEEIFNTNSFAEYLLRILNPSIQSTTLQNDLKKPIESIIFKFYKAGTRQNVAAKLIDPYTVNLMKDKEPIDLRKTPADINEIILLDLLAFIEERGIKKHEILGDTEDMRYIEMVSNIFNDYVTKRGKDITKIDIEKAEFAKGDEFDLNVELIPSQRTKDILNENPQLKDLFKIMLGSLKKKRKNGGNIMTPSVINDFNQMVDKVIDVIQPNDDDSFKTFDDYLKIKSTNESLLPTAEEMVVEEKVLNYNSFINLGRVIVEEDGKTLVRNKKTGDEYEVKNPDPKKHEIVEPKGKEDKEADEQPQEGASEKISKLSNRVGDEIEKIKDPDKKENAEQVLDTLNVINDPNAPKEDKIEAIQALNDAGLIARNSVTAKATKMYLNTSATGLPRKLLVPSSGSPSEITNLMKEIGLENFSPEGGKIGRKEMTAAKIFGEEKVVNVKTEVLEDGIQIGGGKIQKTKIPSDDELLKVYGSKEEADLAKKFLERRNNIIDSAMNSFKSGEMSIIEPVPNTPPSSPKNRDKLKNATADSIVEGFEEQFKKTGNTPSKSQTKILNDFKNLKDIKDPEEYDKELHRLTEEMFADPFFDSATADVAEMVTYMSELNKGNEVYMPAQSNYPLGDIISISPEKIDFEKDSPEEIQRKMQLIYNGVEARSIKKGAGGASASGVKTDQSSFNEVTNKKGEKISPDEIKNDLSDLSDKDKVYKELMFGDVDKAAKRIEEIAEKYDFDLNDEGFKKRRDQSVNSAVENILSKPKCEGSDRENLKKKLESYFNQGEMYASVYNENVNEQLFVNEQYKYTKTKGLDVNRTDGVNKLARLNFAFSAGSWSCDGRPSNPVPTRFVNDK
jgi:hypothetical protein